MFDHLFNNRSIKQKCSQIRLSFWSELAFTNLFQYTLLMQLNVCIDMRRDFLWFQDLKIGRATGFDASFYLALHCFNEKLNINRWLRLNHALLYFNSYHSSRINNFVTTVPHESLCSARKQIISSFRWTEQIEKTQLHKSRIQAESFQIVLKQINWNES